jgi:hypothetical protein
VSDIPAEEEICSLGELYSYTLTHDGLRIFAALSSAFRLPIHGADASCGYQQARQLEAKPIYVHKPSHASYYDLTMEQLAETRMWLLKVFKAEVMQGIKKIYRKSKRKMKNSSKHGLLLKLCTVYP